MTKLSVSAKDFMPPRQTLPALRQTAKTCHGCHLYKNAIQTVFGDGSLHAPLIVLGEIPGKKEDETGKPFTGPAGMFLRQSINSAGLNMEDIYFTNVVKHFKFALINRKKIHRTPVASEINACKPWLTAEIDLIQPQLILCLGLIAAKALIKGPIRLREERGKLLAFTEQIRLLITFHPSAILRAITPEDRHKMKQLFLKDIRKAARFLAK